MAAFVRLPSGSWRALVRRKGKCVSRTFRLKDDARSWATSMEGMIERGENPSPHRSKTVRTFGDLVDVHVADMKEVGRAPGRTKDASLRMLKAELGSLKFSEIDRERLVRFGRERAAQGAGPVTLSMDIGLIKLVMQHAAAVHGLPAKVEPVELARTALKRLGLVGKSRERNRRPTEEEIERLIAYFDGQERSTIPMGRVVKFAIATAMRQEEIFRVTWDDLNTRTKMLTIRDRKDPRHKDGNDQRIPLLAVSGYDAVALLEEQRALRSNGDPRIFPHKSGSACMAFTRACQALGIEDLHFHDLRHEGTSRLFEAGYRIEHAALVTGHRDWKMLRRYTHLRPELLHDLARNMDPQGRSFA